MAEFNSEVLYTDASQISQFNNTDLPSFDDDDEIDDELLVEEVKQMRILWDTSCRGYKDLNKKNQAWKEISLRLHKNDLNNGSG